MEESMDEVCSRFHEYEEYRGVQYGSLYGSLATGRFNVAAQASAMISAFPDANERQRVLMAEMIFAYYDNPDDPDEPPSSVESLMEMKAILNIPSLCVVDMILKYIYKSLEEDQFYDIRDLIISLDEWDEELKAFGESTHDARETLANHFKSYICRFRRVELCQLQTILDRFFDSSPFFDDTSKETQRLFVASVIGAHIDEFCKHYDIKDLHLHYCRVSGRDFHVLSAIN
jgi:hypothetical protein